MEFRTYGSPELPAVMLVHGATWSGLFVRQAEILRERYHIILPVLDGHGLTAAAPYVSTERCARQLLDYADRHHDGRLFALGGVSLGGQIAIEMLTRRSRLCRRAIIESASCTPHPWMRRTGRIVHRLMFRAQALNAGRSNRRKPPELRLPEREMELYARELSRLCRDGRSVDAIFDSHLAYGLSEEIRGCEAEILCWYASREPKAIRDSALLLREYAPRCTVQELTGYRHGELAAHRPDEWVRRAEAFWQA
ncbi:alpha/beta hydrolase [Saccharibacillus sp. CPCC 101409]|uniref:alpha/beta fold hydrolase n=1 Tax=Saccharibacillus sp. CPCC 101409 TaxID=3058041 RepID=UPI00267237A6|nr:alpha/beta hydrolase [Saccharibacillus sp. CPCC 101409]MDO3410954.1 alpha/beta hydrolase [Saccharibacillus sp. CPCC 101409]